MGENGGVDRQVPARARALAKRYVSILFPDPPADGDARERAEPEFFGDVNLDQVVEAVTKGRDEYRLAPFFYTPLRAVDAVDYRQQVMRDIDGTALAGHLARFGKRMQAVRRGIAYSGNVRYPQVSWRWLLDAAVRYVEAVTQLGTDLADAEPRSAGMRSFGDHVAAYLHSEDFTVLAEDARAVTEALDKLDYSLTVKGDKVQIRRYDAEDDYVAQIEDMFARFRHGAVKDYLVEYRDTVTVGHIEAQVLEKIARLFPEQFAQLQHFCATHRDFIDDTIAVFDRQVQFYLAYLDYLRPLRKAGLGFCYPAVSADSRQVDVYGTFDVALADKLVAEHNPVVRNDLRLADPERIVVVTGPNQGGKTTFARTVAQLAHLARLGLPVPGSSARLPLVDAVFTHFERGENLTDLRGKLQDDLIRIRDILRQATGDSLIVLNEIFTSTTLEDALALSTNILGRLSDLDALAVCVTFIDELADLNTKTVSMVAGVDPDDPTRRTFQLERRPAARTPRRWPPSTT